MLEHYRIVDLCSGISQFAGYLLTTLGAEVIAVEPPTGTPTRHQGPYFADTGEPEDSLLHWAYNQGKKSVTLDVESADGYAQLCDLIASADAVIQDSNQGLVQNAKLSYEAFSQINEAIVHATITPYGMGGPRADWVGSDLTAVAGSGFLNASGDNDRPPVRVSAVPQSFLQGSADAAAAILIALYEAQRSGLGQHIDVSAMVSMTHGQPQNLCPRVGANPIGRLAGGLTIGGVDVPLLFPCADGHTVCVSLMGVVLAPFSKRLVEWENEEGFADQELLDIDWENFGTMVLAGEISVDLAVHAFATHARFLATKTKDELWEAAFERHLLLTPSATIEDLVTNEHLEERGFWQDETVSTPTAGASALATGAEEPSADEPEASKPAASKTVRFPGQLAAFSEGQPAPRSSVPKLGEHNNEVDLTRKPFATTTPAAKTTPAATTTTAPAAAASKTSKTADLPLAGLKVLEFSWVIATPSAVRILADYGATVVKVETESRPDTMRTVIPFVDEDPHPDNSVGYGVYNAGKRSISLELSKPESREVILDLIKWADIVTESFSPGAFSRMGYSYEMLAQANPELIMLSSTLLGQTGPFSSLAGYGYMAAAIAGFYEITGWPDRGPAGPYGPYTDYLAPRVVVAVLMAALEQRKRTGRGCYIDLSQTECALHYLSPAILDVSANGRTAQRCGNDDPTMSPHGVFASEGDDKWVAIACTDEMWPALARAIDRDDLAALTQAERRARSEEIADAITTWTQARPAKQAAIALQKLGVDAYPVNNPQDCCEDEQLDYLKHHIEVPQTHRGTMWTHNCRTTMGRTPAEVWRGGPCLGEDNFEVLSDYLGYSGEKIAELAAAEVLS